MAHESISQREATLGEVLHQHEEALAKLAAVFLGRAPEEAELIAMAAAFRAGMRASSLHAVIRKGGLFRSASVENEVK